MNSASVTLEDRIRERAYYLWEADGRPPGRDIEFWQRACAAEANGKTPAKRAKPRAAGAKRGARRSA